jgi:DNA-binding CsgD family transcriptional regulator
MMKISKREKEILTLIAFEYTAKEIARKLYISTHTVDTHRKNLLDKMQARNTAGIVRKGFEYGILST